MRKRHFLMINVRWSNVANHVLILLAIFRDWKDARTEITTQIFNFFAWFASLKNVSNSNSHPSFTLFPISELIMADRFESGLTTF